MLDLIRTTAARPDVKALLDAWPRLSQAVVDEALAIQAIPAPTFGEAARAAHVEHRLASLGLQDVHQDTLHNVYARLPGTRPELPAVLVGAHLDTVFPASTPLQTRHTGRQGRIYGPGLGDNSVGVAAMLALASMLKQRGPRLPADIWWVATVGEEGLGNLKGMREVQRRLGAQLGVAIILEGIGIGRIYSAGLGVRRLGITVRGPGGHSWLHADRPSAIHEIVRIGAALVDGIPLPEDPRTTLNIGLIEGGRSINTRAPQASMAIDLRSSDVKTLTRLEQQVRAIAAQHAHPPDLTVQVDLIGERPCAALSDEHPLVQAALATLRYLGFETHPPESGSTDANVLLAAHLPAVCVGITSGGNAHTLEEYIEPGMLPLGMAQITLLTITAAEHSAEWGRWF
ncbi:MAG: M20/M25/M40 family metallo-hydrolase [Anaerolineae bacterium]